jgi:hypothetical protein
MAGIHALVARHYLGKPDLEEFLAIKFPDAGALLRGALNEAAYRLGSAASFRLETLNVEITNRCNLRCTYCPVNRDLARGKRDMPLDAFVDLLDRSPTIRNLLPFQWGEPLLHRDLFAMLEAARDRGVRVFLTTNGTLLDDAACRALLKSGVTRLTISVDGDDATHAASRGIELAPIRERVTALRRMRDAAGAPLAIDVSMVLDEQTAPGLEDYLGAWRGVVDRVQVIPRMIRGRRTTSCREPWRGLLVVLADGSATACCADSEGELALGNAFEQDPATIFGGEAMARLRRAHASLDLPTVCASCTEYADPRVSPRFA